MQPVLVFLYIDIVARFIPNRVHSKYKLIPRIQDWFNSWQFDCVCTDCTVLVSRLSSGTSHMGKWYMEYNFVVFKQGIEEIFILYQ